MTVGELENVIFALSGRMTSIDQQRFFTLIQLKTKRIAMDTIPLTMVVTKENATDVFRRIDNDTFIKKPSVVLNKENVLDVEDELAEALALLILAELETVRAKTYMGLYHTEIENNNSRLVEVTLTEASNDSAYINRVWV